MSGKKLIIFMLIGLLVLSITGLVNAEEKTLRIWSGQSGEREDYWCAVMREEFEEVYPDIKVEYRYIPGSEIMEELTRAFIVGDVPDVIGLDNPMHASFAEAGHLLDITDMIKESDIIDPDNFNPAPRNSVTWEGRLYGVPRGSDTLAIYYNADMFEEAGLDSYNPPRTWEEFEEAARKLTDKEEGVYGLGMALETPTIANWQWSPFLYQNGGSFKDIDSPEAVEALEYIVNMVEDGVITKEAVGMGQAELTGQFLAERYGMMVMGNWELSRVHREADFNWKTMPMPYKKGVDSEKSSALGGWNYAIPADAENKEEAFKYLEFWHREETQENLWNYEGRGLSVNHINIKSPNYLHSYYVWEKQLAETFARGPHPDWPSIDEAINEEIHSAVMGKKSSEAALQDAAEKLDEIFAENPWPSD